MEEFKPEIQELINRLDLQKAHFKGNDIELWCLCPWHNDKHPNNFSINLITGKCYCFSCLAGGTVINFSFERGMTYTEAHSLWNTVKKPGGEKIFFIESPANDWLVDHYMANGFSEIALKRMDHDVAILDEYNVYCDTKDNVVFFIRDHYNQVRAILTKNGKEDIPIYNETWKQQGFIGGMHLEETRYRFVVEDIWSAMHINKLLEQKTLFLGGVYISPYQLYYLSQCNQKTYFMFDGDDAGRKARDKVHEQIRKLKNSNMFYFCGGYNCDPDELQGGQLEDIRINAKNWNEYELFRKEKTNNKKH